MSQGIKHLVKCRCILPQFKRVQNSPTHQFVVFSVIDDDNTVKVKFAQCTNCGVIHKVSEINKSEIITNREAMSSLVTIDDIRPSLPPGIASILDANLCDLPSWEAAQFIIHNKKWGDYVVLTSDSEGGLKQGKYVIILSETMLKVESYVRQEEPNK